MKIVLLFVLSVSCCHELSSQKHIIPVKDDFQGRFFNYRINQPGADITSTYIFFDSGGFMWSGTYTGLYRFDGMEYKGFHSGSTDSTGLAGNQVSSIIEDHSGTIWVSTLGALNRIDKRTWTCDHFFPDPANIMDPSNRIHKLFYDSNGLIWLITSEDIYSFNPSETRFRKFIIDTLGFNKSTNAASGPGKVIEDSEGRIWFATSHGLYRYEYTTDRFDSFYNIPGDEFSIPGNSIAYLASDASGRIWLSAEGHGLVLITDQDNGRFRKISRTLANYPESGFDSITTILPDSKGNIWSFGPGTFSCYYPEKNEFLFYKLPEPKNLWKDHWFNRLGIKFAWEDKEGDIWFLHSIEGFMFRFDPESETAKMIFVPNFSVFYSAMDLNGNFWFACGRNNIWSLVLSGIPFTGTSIPDNFNVNGVKTAIMAEDDENLWMRFSSGIYKSRKPSDSNPVIPEKFIFPDGSTYASALYRDKAGNIWFARDNGKITVMDPVRKTFKDFLLPEGHTGPVSDFEENDSGTMWIISPYTLFAKEKKENSVRIVSFRKDSLNKYISGGLYNVFSDSRNYLWFASFGNGVFSCNPATGKANFYGPSEGLDIPYGDYCLRIAEDSNGMIWILFYSNGLYMLDPSGKRFVKADLGMRPGEVIYFNLHIDNNDRILIAHSAGFTFYKQEGNIVRNVRHPMLPGRSFFHRTEDGILMFTHGNQLLLFRDSLYINKVIPPVWITSLLVNGKEYSTLHPGLEDITKMPRVILNFRQNNIRIGFSALNYQEPEYNRYRYFMKGVDRDTVYLDGSYRYAEYKDLKPGRYTFHVTGSNNDQVWNREGKTITVRINPPWFASSLSYSLYAAFIVLSIWLLFRWRIRYLKSEKEHLEKLVMDRTAELERKNQYIEEIDRLKTRFFSEISHEIRTPLSLISGPVNSLIIEKENRGDESDLRMMKIIQRNADRLLKLVNQLLDISKIDAGKMNLTLEKSDILKCIRLLVYGFLSVSDRRNIRFIVSVPDDPLETFFDRDKVEKIISNLLVNAFKFTPAGGTITFKTTVSTTRNNDGCSDLILRVTDTGSGISKENISKVFDRFYSTRGQWEKDGKGTGIGLALISEFVRIMHGKITVESEAGKGTEFEVYIPLGLSHLSENEYSIVDPADLESGNDLYEENHTTDITEISFDQDNARKNHLLIVEDNDDLRFFIRDHLKSEFSVYESENGNKGLEIAVSKVPDIIITDIIMPGISGIELCRRLKNDDRTSHIPVIMLTARTTTDDKIEGLISGADDYLYKPFEIRELRARIFNLMKQREQLRLKYGLMTGFEMRGTEAKSVDDRFMERIAGVIMENIRDFEFDVGSLQEHIGMSRVHLYRKIKALTGMTPLDLIKNCRMKEAARLLSLKTGNVSEIAFSVGFSNPAYFSKVFKDYYGVSPKDFSGRNTPASNLNA